MKRQREREGGERERERGTEGEEREGTMVWFQCEDCGDSIKKPKLDAHFMRCSARRLSCIDCLAVFDRHTVKVNDEAVPHRREDIASLTLHLCVSLFVFCVYFLPFYFI